jgi:hypothetical protein
MSKKLLQSFFTLIFIANVNAQVINSGGGGPERDDKIDKEAREVIQKREDNLKSLKEKIKEWVKKAKANWQTCHGEKIEAKNIIDLYLVISLKEATSEFREVCKKKNKTNCIFKDKKENEKLRNILKDEMIEDYLIEKGLKGKKSRTDLMNFYMKKIKGK